MEPSTSARIAWLVVVVLVLLAWTVPAANGRSSARAWTPTPAFLTAAGGGPLAREAHAPAAAAAAATAAAEAEAASHPGKELVVVMSDKATRLYHDLRTPGCKAPTFTIQHPPDLRHFERHGGRGRPRHKEGRTASHYSPPQPKAGRTGFPDKIDHFYRAIEQNVRTADRVVIIGHGKGKGQAAETLLKDLSRTKPHVTAKIRGVVRLDDTHLTDRQVLQVARQVLRGRPDARKRRVIHGQPLRE